MTDTKTSPAKRNCDGQPSLAPATCWTARLETPRTDKETWTTIAGAFKCSGANGDLEGEGEYVQTTFARRLEREISVLFDFINREMKMTGSDPRIAELEKRIAALSNAPHEPCGD